MKAFGFARSTRHTGSRSRGRLGGLGATGKYPGCAISRPLITVISLDGLGTERTTLFLSGIFAGKGRTTIEEVSRVIQDD